MTYRRPKSNLLLEKKRHKHLWYPSLLVSFHKQVLETLHRFHNLQKCYGTGILFCPFNKTNCVLYDIFPKNMKAPGINYSAGNYKIFSEFCKPWTGVLYSVMFLTLCNFTELYTLYLFRSLLAFLSFVTRVKVKNRETHRK